MKPKTADLQDFPQLGRSSQRVAESPQRPGARRGPHSVRDAYDSEDLRPRGADQGKICGRVDKIKGFRPKPMTASDRHPTGGPTPSGRQTLVVGSHHCPGSQARGCGPTPSGRQMLPLGSHHCPGSQARGVGPTPSGNQALLNGSHHCPGSHAELTAGVPIVATAVAAAASMTTAANRPARFRIADLLESM